MSKRRKATKNINRFNLKEWFKVSVNINHSVITSKSSFKKGNTFLRKGETFFIIYTPWLAALIKDS